MAERSRRALSEFQSVPLETLDKVLTMFQLGEHSIGILAILIIKLKQVLNENQVDLIEATIGQISEFAIGSNQRQIRSVPDIYCELFRTVADYFLVKKMEPERGIEILSNAIDRLANFKSQLTSLHSALICLCLKARNFSPAIPYLDANITDILKELPTGAQHMDTLHFLCYFYYGGMLYSALKQFDRALFFFEIVLTTPSTAVSSVLVEAYKKYVLVSLISTGSLQTLPLFQPAIVSTNIRPIVGTYQKLATLYTGTGPDKAAAMEEHLSMHRIVFEQDNNVGLVKQVIRSLHKRNIQRLTKTFLTLSLFDVAVRCHLLGGAEEAEKYIQHMIQSDEISATIDSANQMVNFEDVTKKVDSGAVEAQVI